MTTITLNSKLVELFNIFQLDNWFYCAPIYILGDEHFSLEFSWLAMKDNKEHVRILLLSLKLLLMVLFIFISNMESII